MTPARTALGVAERADADAGNPRIRARRVEVARTEGRRRLRRLLAAASLAALLLGGLAIVHSSFFAVRSVRIVGAVHTTRAEVLAATRLDRHPPLVDVDADSDEAALERLPWVKAARVETEWPSGVTVELVERRPVCQVRLGAGGFALIDGSGHVLADVAARSSGLAVVVVPGGVPAPGGTLAPDAAPVVETAGALPVSLVGRVASIGTENGTGIVLHLAHGPLVVLGSPSALGEKMTALATLLTRAPLSGFVTIDLRVPASPVLTP